MLRLLLGLPEEIKQSWIITAPIQNTRNWANRFHAFSNNIVILWSWFKYEMCNQRHYDWFEGKLNVLLGLLGLIIEKSNSKLTSEKSWDVLILVSTVLRALMRFVIWIWIMFEKKSFSLFTEYKGKRFWAHVANWLVPNFSTNCSHFFFWIESKQISYKLLLCVSVYLS